MIITRLTDLKSNAEKIPSDTLNASIHDSAKLPSKSSLEDYDSSTHNKTVEGSIKPSHRELLQNLGGPALENSSLQEVQDMLDHLAHDRVQNAKNGLLDLNGAIDSSLALNLDAAAITSQILVDELLGETSWHDIQFLNEGLKLRITELENSIGTVGADMGNLDLEKRDLDSKKSRDFVMKWNT